MLLSEMDVKAHDLSSEQHGCGDRRSGIGGSGEKWVSVSHTEYATDRRIDRFVIEVVSDWSELCAAVTGVQRNGWR